MLSALSLETKRTQPQPAPTSPARNAAPSERRSGRWSRRSAANRNRDVEERFVNAEIVDQDVHVRQPRQRALHALASAAVDRHLRALGGEPRGYGKADAVGRAGDKRPAVTQIEIRPSPSSPSLALSNARAAQAGTQSRVSSAIEPSRPSPATAAASRSAWAPPSTGAARLMNFASSRRPCAARSLAGTPLS